MVVACEVGAVARNQEKAEKKAARKTEKRASSLLDDGTESSFAESVCNLEFGADEHSLHVQAGHVVSMGLTPHTHTGPHPRAGGFDPDRYLRK
jgi:hypothetical protein